MRSESRRLYAVDYAKSECSARASVEEYDPTPVPDSRPLTRIARLALTAAQLHPERSGTGQRACSTCLAGRRREWCGGRRGRSTRKSTVDPSSTACKHSEGSSATQVEVQPQETSSRIRLTVIPRNTFKSCAESRRKATVDHGRGMAAASLHSGVLQHQVLTD